jgi:DNA polymerase elongation subunit (family B)
MNFYTHAYQRGNVIYLRGIENGKRFKTKVEYAPYLFVNSKNKTSEFKTLTGKPVDKIDFGSIYEAKDFLKQYNDISGMDIYGFDRFVYCFLNDEYPGEIVYDKDLINIVNIDIEVESDSGFPDVRQADKRITAITMKMREKIMVFGCGEFTTDNEHVHYFKAKNEAQLLLDFINVWRKLDIDIVTGWNAEFFDIPYIVNRITKVHGGEFAKKLSPWGMLLEQDVEVNNRKQQSYTLVGISNLDYLELYRKYTYAQQESYRLDYICSIEIDERKVDYSEFDNLFTLYKEDFQKFIEYNIKDVLLVDKLDEKLKFIDQALTIAYDAKTNIEDVFTSVRLWDVIIHNYLLSKKTVIPQFVRQDKSAQFAGAFVKDPLVGLHNWVVSFDINSLYPSLIVQYNISPECYSGKIGRNFNIDQLLAGGFDDDEIQDFIKEKNYAITANSCIWDKSKKGAFPELVEKMMTERKMYKNRMIEAKKKYEKNPSKELSNEIARNNNMQMARKIQLNSLYGTLGNQYSRWFQLEFAEAITLTGQFVIRWVAININQYLNKLLKTDNKDYIIAIDTDSNYLVLDAVVKKFFDGKDVDTITTAVDKICNDKLEPLIDKCFADLAQHTNAYTNFLKMKRESIANKGIWTAKKRYMLNVYDNEGVRYKEPKLKMMGIEAVKSSTPSACRAKIKEAIKIIMETDETTLQSFIQRFREEFRQMPFEDIAFPRGCRGLSEYSHKTEVYKKGTPIHVRGALLYNMLLERYEVTSKYQRVQEGEKIKFCYLKLPNHIQQNVISVPTVLPKQFDLNKCIDYDTQFDKAFLDPLRIILDVIGWQPEKIATLEDFFS